MMIRVRRLLLFILIVCVLGLLTYIYVFSDVGLLKIAKLEEEKKALEDKLITLRKENAELRNILNDEKLLNEFIDKKMKGELGMINEGDMIILFDNGKNIYDVKKETIIRENNDNHIKDRKDN
ncbi:MAG: septum formation initiator family protein [bacterium]